MQGTYTSSPLYKDLIRVNRIHSSVKERSSKKGGLISNAKERRTGIVVPAVQRNMITSRSRSSGSKKKFQTEASTQLSELCKRAVLTTPAVCHSFLHATLHDSSIKL